MTPATIIMYRKVVEFLFVIFVAANVAKGKPLIDSAPNVNFCMADPGKCDSNIYLNFSQIFTQFGCAERCSQYENCNWWTWYDYTYECHLYENCNLNTNVTDNCSCYTSERCDSNEETTPALVGGISTKVEVLLDGGPSPTVVEALPEERQFPAVAAIGDKVFLCGGADSSGKAKETCFYYNFVQRKWITMSKGIQNGSISRSVGIAAYWDFYILGGENDQGVYTNYVQIMNGKTKNWRMGPPMPKPLAGHCAIRDWDVIYVIGSADSTLEVFLFNITTQNWTTLHNNQNSSIDNAPTARQDFACALSDDKNVIYLTGGNLTKNGTILNEFYTFNIRKHIWTPMMQISQPRSGHIMTTFQNLPTIVGGVDDKNKVLVTMESLHNHYNWTVLSYKLTNGRKNFGVTRVPTYLLPPPS